jgi:hypothetical protein
MLGLSPHRIEATRSGQPGPYRAMAAQQGQRRSRPTATGQVGSPVRSDHGQGDLDYRAAHRGDTAAQDVGEHHGPTEPVIDPERARLWLGRH